jgi:hypothetical protein
MGVEVLATKKVLAAAVMAVLVLSMLSLSVPALSQNQESEEEEQEVEVSTEVSVKVKGNEVEVEVEVEGSIEDGEYEISFDCKTKPEAYAGAILTGTLMVANGKGETELEGELVAGAYADCTVTFGDFSEPVVPFTVADIVEKAKKKIEQLKSKVTSQGFSMKVELEGTTLEMEVEVKEEAAISDGTYAVELVCDVKPEAAVNPIVSGTLVVEDGEGEAEVEAELVAGTYSDCTFTFGDRSMSVGGFVVAEVEVEEEEEDDEDDDDEGKAKVKAEAKAKASLERAEKARTSAEAKGRAEVVENIDNAERYFGKSDKAVVGLKLSLASDDPESMSFGSAQLILIKVGDKEPMFRAVVHVLTDQPVESMSACLDGDKIGELRIIQTSPEAGITIGHMRESLTGKSITIPGVTVDVVEGTGCTGTAIVSGSV